MNRIHHTNTLAALNGVANFLREYDPPRQQSGNLLENDGVALTFNPDGILFVAIGAGRVHGVQELACLIFGRPVSLHPWEFGSRAH